MKLNHHEGHLSMKIKLEPTKDLLDLDESERIRWAIALESGEYEQGIKVLYSERGYCCLGVWERINGSKDSDLVGLTYPTQIDNPTRISRANNSIKYPPLPEDIKPACHKGINYTFDSLNDGFSMYIDEYKILLKLNFNEIAQLLRGNSVEIGGVALT